MAMSFPAACTALTSLAFSMKIALISDTHFAAVAQDFLANGQAACTWVDSLDIDLAVHLGDITADGVIHPEHYTAARRVLSELKTPLRLLPGNHDIGDNPSFVEGKQPEETVRTDALALYRRTFGPDRWSFRQAAWTVIGLNAQLFGTGGAEEEAQAEWLTDTLSRVGGPLGLMLHKPLFRTHPEDGDAHHRYVPPPPRLSLFEQLRRHDLRFVVSGHTHQSRRLIHDGVEHVWAPSTAFIIPDRMQERIGDKHVGVMTLTLSSDSHRFELARPNGMRTFDVADYPEVYPRLATVGALPSPAEHG